MSIFSTITRIAGEYSRSRARYLTERAIDNLPVELRKDIGWPDAIEGRKPHNFGIGAWAGSK